VVVTDQVTICRGEVTEVVRVADTVDREVLRVDTVGDARVQYPSERRGGGWG
jgi:stress response protein YsnF